jgi:NAD(P)-dependent dehydrogenase (short-subunit alcohol dehydrogenase family)
MLTPENILLKGKTAVVTGAGRGIGYAIAETLANFKARVVLLDRDPDLLLAAREKILAAGGDASTRLVDVTDSAAVSRLAHDLVESGERIDILVNNVGDHLNLIKPFLDSSEE